MKPSAFEYHRPETLAEALSILAELGADGKVLAGGQSLVPMLNMRLAAPAHLVDVNRLSELSRIDVTPDAVTVGAIARHAEVEHSADAERVLPLLRQALTHVAHPTIRNRGTTVGSIVHADPAGEMPSVLALLGGSVQLASASGSRVVPVDDFFLAPLESATRPGELATSVTFPIPAGHTGTAWLEVSRRHGDYAMCGLGALVTLDEDLRIASARATYVSMGPTPVTVDFTELVVGRSYDAADWAAAARLAGSSVEPEEDIHATAEYRRHLAGVLTGRALKAAAAHAVARTEVPA
ncbi:FAD binding domain-containing protein [Cryptosporangium aurantiacum]|uniref:Carbon-monoxide dehydrogenase medium subunit n=1 Tax=Cryptosporangium aurantiacum TaxID=134849 RepID=A0A1M7N7S0_9ACTN|nr:xanthine dehydrogenase family protein subunit M [Cryptosporangium aurantiacum]SHM99608.1 carbon-monoxide dehydrogenase medium subunit [Cryptosporangium aurantiacum]